LTTTQLNSNGEYPRPLTSRERAWIEWILPSDREGYLDFREKLTLLEVIGEGRRGKGEIVLGRTGQEPDFTYPLPPVFAYGMIETDSGGISITIRQILDDQVSIEIASHRSDEIPGQYVEQRRWTYSTWERGQSCPQCRESCREVSMRMEGSEVVTFVLAICSRDRRLWVHDGSSRVNRLIPVTNYYNELILHKGIRDPKIALDSKNLFKCLPDFTDADLIFAFQSYNKLKTKVQVEGSLQFEHPVNKASLKKIFHLFKKT
jgi:hypothetical protein